MALRSILQRIQNYFKICMMVVLSAAAPDGGVSAPLFPLALKDSNFHGDTLSQELRRNSNKCINEMKMKVKCIRCFPIDVNERIHELASFLQDS